MRQQMIKQILNHSAIISFSIDESGKHFYYPLSDTTNGKLIVQEKGNMQLNTSWTVYDLAFGTYRWGVQAIDNSFTGSSFSSADLDHREGGPLSIGQDEVRLVFANPSINTLSFTAPKDLTSFAIVTMDGKIVHQQIVSSTKSIYLPLSSGIYVIKANYNDGKQINQKVIMR